jgi:hypothetical protein
MNTMDYVRQITQLQDVLRDAMELIERVDLSAWADTEIRQDLRERAKRLGVRL